MDIAKKNAQNSKAGRRGGSAFDNLRRIVSLMEDRLSTLPNDLLDLILSKVPIREATRCSILSKRWRYAYTHISQIQLSPSLLLGPLHHPDVVYPRESVEDIISTILSSHASNVERFHLSIDYQLWQFSSDKVSRWVQYAASKNVQRIVLCQCPHREIPPPATLFTCARLTALELYNYILTDIPNTFLGFKHLISCSFSNVEFTDDSLALFILRCPLLQTLTIDTCYGLLNPVIAATNITDIVIDNYIEALTITCPKLITLTALPTETRTVLRVNGVFFNEFSRAVCRLKMEDVSTLVGLSLVLMLDEEKRNFSAVRLLDFVSNFKSLKKLYIDVVDDDLERINEEMDVPLYKMLERLPNLERLGMGALFARELARDQIPERLSSPLANLRILQVDTCELHDKELAVLGCLFQSSPALEIMQFQTPKEHIHTPEYIQFTEKLFSMRKASTQVRISHGIVGDEDLIF